MSDHVRADCLRDIDAVILAGGYGTRVKAVLGDTPKILAPVGGRPFVEYLLDWLESFGAKRVVFCLGHLSEKVRAHLARAERTIRIETTVEEKPLGTARALANAMPLLHSSPILALNGDSFVDVDLCAFVESHRSSGAPASLVCTEVEFVGRFGSVTVDRESRIVRFAEKDSSAGDFGMINAGVYLLNSAFLAKVRDSEARSVEQDVFSRQAPHTLNAFCGRFSFIDIGTPETFARAAEAMVCFRGETK